MHDPADNSPKQDAIALGELIRTAEAAASGTPAASAIRAVHKFAYAAARRHAELIGLDLDDDAEMATLSGGTPKGLPDD